MDREGVREDERMRKREDSERFRLGETLMLGTVCREGERECERER